MSGRRRSSICSFTKRYYRDKRIIRTGCAGKRKKLLGVELLQLTHSEEEQTRMNDCYYEKRDWRACKAEVGTKPRVPTMLIETDGGIQGMLEAQRK